MVSIFDVPILDIARRRLGFGQFTGEVLAAVGDRLRDLEPNLGLVDPRKERLSISNSQRFLCSVVGLKPIAPNPFCHVVR